jgi:tRNA threonylcarbamoyladenosine biosynthesis protein TsaB
LKILGIETSSRTFSLALSSDADLLYELRQDRQTYGGSRDAGLFTSTKELFTRFELSDVDAIALSIGPGMFTSLRVGLSLAKGLALAHAIPVVSVNTLDIIGIPLSFTDLPVTAVINAFHKEIYTATYKHGSLVRDHELTTPELLLERIGERTILAGPGIDALSNVRRRAADDALIFLTEDFTLPSAAKTIRLAIPMVRAKKYDDIETLEPYYIKKTDAQRNYHKKNEL